jgi:hypothetical protein
MTRGKGAKVFSPFVIRDSRYRGDHASFGRNGIAMCHQRGATLMPRARIATWHCASLMRPAVTAGLCCYAIFLSGISAAAQQTYDVAASKSRWNVDLSQISCISLLENGAHIFGADYFNDTHMPKILKDAFPNVAVERQNEQCRNVFGFTILYTSTTAVAYQNKTASIVMSFSLCERDEFKKIDSHKCGYKNIYSFLPKLEPLQALEIGVKAFVHEQIKQWEIVKVSVGSGQ